MCLSIGTPEAINFPFVSNEKLMFFRCPNIQAHCNEAVIYLNFGTPKNNEFSMSKDDHWLNNSVVSRIASGPGFESRSGHDFFLPCDIWWLSVGSRLGQRASKCACLVVPPLF